jgi:hypothetical protein
MAPFENDDKYDLSSSLSFTRSIAIKSSLETMVQNALAPVQIDTHSFSSKKAKEVLKDVRALLVELVRTEKNEVAKKALNRLIKLIEENIELRSVLEIHMDRVKKV